MKDVTSLHDYSENNPAMMSAEPVRQEGYLIVADFVVRQDSEGRFCLNDLHKAAGGERRHEPLNWRNTDQYKDLVVELENTGIPVITIRGRNGGTFVCKELVYAYAMWISPVFHLKVIRAYDELQTNGVAFSEQTVESVASGEMSEDELVMKAMSVLQSKIERLTAERNGMVKTIGQCTHTINRVVRMFEGVNTNSTKADLLRLGYLYKDHFGSYHVYQEFNHLFVERAGPYSGRGRIYCTGEGKALLASLYMQGELTMKVAYQSQPSLQDPCMFGEDRIR